MKNAKKLIEEIILLLHEVKDTEWTSIFEKLYKEIDDNPAETKLKIKNLYGGMGSFNDLVLYKNGVVLTSENNKLELLREKLYTEL